MNVEVRIRFKVERPLTGEEASRMWMLGSHFGAISQHTYQLTTVAQNTDPIEAAQLLARGIPSVLDMGVLIVGLTVDQTDKERANPPRSRRSNAEARRARAPRPQTV